MQSRRISKANVFCISDHVCEQSFRLASEGTMRSSKQCLRARRGVIAPLAAIFMVLMIGMVAFAIDVGYMTLVRTELQSAADAAASAGAAALLTSPADAKTAAQTFGNS